VALSSFVPGRSGSIVPNGAMGGDVNVVVNVDAKGSSVEGINHKLRRLVMPSLPQYNQSWLSRSAPEACSRNGYLR
jgi:hypothetical protein